jgi:hypothetical protein
VPEHDDLLALCDRLDQARAARRPGGVVIVPADALGELTAAARRLLADRQAVQRVEALAEELQGWRDNAQRYADGAVMGSVYERSLGRVRAYERAIEGIRRALGTTS